MAATTNLQRRLGLEHPIVQAPMAGAATPELAAAVSQAGGLGSLGLATSTPENARRQIRTYRQATGRPLNVNFFCHEEPTDVARAARRIRERLAAWYEARGLGPVPEPAVPYPTFGAEHVDLVREERPEVVSFHFGLPEKRLLDAVKETGALVLSSATTVAEARLLEENGADAVIAQGLEAGGHRGTFRGPAPAGQPGLFALLPQVRSAVSVPVIAAGGIFDGRTMAAAMVLGADLVQVGTAFLRCPEANVHPSHRRALAEARDDATRVTRLFSGRPARALSNAYMGAFADLEDDAAPFPAQLALTAPLRAAEGGHNPGEVMSLWAGQSAAMTRETGAAELVHLLAREARAALGRS